MEALVSEGYSREQLAKGGDLRQVAYEFNQPNGTKQNGNQNRRDIFHQLFQFPLNAGNALLLCHIRICLGLDINATYHHLLRVHQAFIYNLSACIYALLTQSLAVRANRFLPWATRLFPAAGMSAPIGSQLRSSEVQAHRHGSQA